MRDLVSSGTESPRLHAEVGDSVCLFVDDQYVHEVRNIRRVRHRPTKHPTPLIVQDREWENAVWFHVSNFSVVFDRTHAEFVCFYEDQRVAGKTSGGAIHDSASRMLQRAGSRYLRATSVDGTTWSKPEDGLTLPDGMRTNIVLDGGVHSGSIIYDGSSPSPETRYKLLYPRVAPFSNRPKRNPTFSAHVAGLFAGTSADGINWTLNEEPVLPWASDVATLHFDPVAGEYVLFGRAQEPAASSHPAHDSHFAPFRPHEDRGELTTKRHIYRLTSPDFANWSEPRLILAPGQDDNLDDEYYGMTSWRAGRHHLGILNVLHGVPNTVDTELVFSDDGVHWKRSPDRHLLIPLGQEGAFDQYMADCPSPPLQVGDEDWIFYGGSRRHHDWWVAPPSPELEESPRATTSLGLARIRRNGWVSLNAGEREGYVETILLFSEGDALEVNALVQPGGHVLGEIKDSWGNVWPGFERTECVPLEGDNVAHVVRWRSRRPLNFVPGYIRVRLYMRQADIYSIRFSRDPG